MDCPKFDTACRLPLVKLKTPEDTPQKRRRRASRRVKTPRLRLSNLSSSPGGSSRKFLRGIFISVWVKFKEKSQFIFDNYQCLTGYVECVFLLVPSARISSCLEPTERWCASYTFVALLCSSRVGSDQWLYPDVFANRGASQTLRDQLRQRFSIEWLTLRVVMKPPWEPC